MALAYDLEVAGEAPASISEVEQQIAAGRLPVVATAGGTSWTVMWTSDVEGGGTVPLAEPAAPA